MLNWIIGGTILSALAYLVMRKDEKDSVVVKEPSHAPAQPTSEPSSEPSSSFIQASHAINSGSSNAKTVDQNAILSAVKAGKAVYEFSGLTSEHNGHRAEFKVFSDALMIDGIRVAVCANTNQYIADALDCSPLTAKLADLIWLQRKTTLPPFPRGKIDDMASIQAMLDHSKRIDKALSNIPKPWGLICTVGKLWVLDNDLITKPGMAMNYGWHYGTEPSYQGVNGEVTASKAIENGKYVRLIQGRGTRHDAAHIDYSQVCVLISNKCIVDGVETRLDALLSNPELAPLANHSGVLRVLRQPTAK